MKNPVETADYQLTLARLELGRGRLDEASAILRQVLADEPGCAEAAAMLDDVMRATAASRPGDDETIDTSSPLERLEPRWSVLGWILFACWLIGPFFAGDPAGALVVYLASLVLWAAWWIVDLTDQRPPAWQVVVGVVMVAIGFLPRGGLLTIAAWVIYWTRVRG